MGQVINSGNNFNFAQLLPIMKVVDLSIIPKDFNPSITHTAYLLRNRLLKSLVKHAPSLTGSIMDFGCGSKPYRALFEVDEYIGVDFHGEGHSHDNESIDVFYDGLTLPFEANRFDGVFTSEVFEHVFNLEHMVKELHRVLKPGGKMLITCPFAICEHEAPNDFARYTSYGIKDLLERNGFRVLAFEKSGTAIETICQIFISYYYQHIVRRFFGKIPVVRTVLTKGGIFLLNVASLLFNAILPQGRDLYMNNVLLVEKK